MPCSLNDRLVLCRSQQGQDWVESKFAVSRNVSTTPVWPVRQTGSCSRRRGTATAFGWHWSLATTLPAGGALTTPPGSAVIAISGRAKAAAFTSGIESSAAGMVSGALPPGLAGSGASRPLQLRFTSQPARNARRDARRDSRLGAIAAGLADGFPGNAGKCRNRTRGAPRGRCAGSRQDGARDLGPGDIRRSSARGAPRQAHAAGGSQKGGRGNRLRWRPIWGPSGSD